MNLHEQYIQMCEKEFRYNPNYDYYVGEHKIILYHEGLEQKELYSLIDETREIINKYGFWYTVEYDKESEAQIFKIAILNFTF